MRAHTTAGVNGFTLVELAIVLVIGGLVLASIVMPLQTQVESRKIQQTSAMIDNAREYLLAFAQSFGYFPCPADAASAGQEPAAADHVSGNCPTWYGFLPARAIGWTQLDPQGYAVDAWGTAGSRIRYAVSNQTVGGIVNPFTRVNGIALAGNAALGSTPLFRVCASGTGVNPGVDCGGAQTLAANAVVVVWSVGANALTGGTTIDEAQNPNPNGGSADRVFVSRAQQSAAAVPFDDIVNWIPGTVVVTRLAR
jgi:prepilin-type N-terminal cleavage/methylation domain-containing protein